jgi:hypothetical protein
MPDGTMKSIGAVMGFTRRIDRNTTRRMELDSDTPGITVEVIPGAISGFSITIRRAMMNQKNMLEAFGLVAIEDLIHQNIPIDIEEHRFLPDGREQIVTYRKCYFKNNPLEVAIDRDWLIIQDAELEVTTAEVKDPS